MIILDHILYIFMKIKTFLVEFVVITVIVFAVSSVIGYLYDLAVHGQGKFDWQGSVRIAISFGIILPLIDIWDRWRKTRK